MHECATSAGGAPSETLRKLLSFSRPQFPPLKHEAMISLLHVRRIKDKMLSPYTQLAQGRRYSNGNQCFCLLFHFYLLKIFLNFDIGNKVLLSIWAEGVLENDSVKAKVPSVGTCALLTAFLITQDLTLNSILEASEKEMTCLETQTDLCLYPVIRQMIVQSLFYLQLIKDDTQMGNITTQQL